MASTVIQGFGTDTLAMKAWSAKLAIDAEKDSYFTRRFVGEGDNAVIQKKTELQSDAGDRVSFDLSVQLRGRPTTGDNRLEGKEENLRFYSDTVVIDQTRKSVSAGGKMTRKRTVHDLRSVAKARLSEYWAAYMDELYFMYLSGARGINEDYIEPTTFLGHGGDPSSPDNALQAPDSQHIIYGGASVVTAKASVTSSDKMSRESIERAVSKARMMRAQDPNAANMLPVTVEGGEARYVCVMSVFQAHDLRTTTGATGWLEIQKASSGADGQKNPIYMGSLGMINNVILHSHESVVRFSDYGSGTNLPASRALFLGRQAGVVAYGTAGGMRFTWEEEMKDYGNEPTVASGTIIGVKKTRFNSRDFGVIAIDTYAKDPNVA